MLTASGLLLCLLENTSPSLKLLWTTQISNDLPLPNAMVSSAAPFLPHLPGLSTLEILKIQSVTSFFSHVLFIFKVISSSPMIFIYLLIQDSLTVVPHLNCLQNFSPTYSTTDSTSLSGYQISSSNSTCPKQNLSPFFPFFLTSSLLLYLLLFLSYLFFLYL